MELLQLQVSWLASVGLNPFVRKGAELRGGCAYGDSEQKVPGRGVGCLAMVRSTHHTDLRHWLQKRVLVWRPVSRKYIISL